MQQKEVKVSAGPSYTCLLSVRVQPDTRGRLGRDEGEGEEETPTDHWSVRRDFSAGGDGQEVRVLKACEKPRLSLAAAVPLLEGVMHKGELGKRAREIFLGRSGGTIVGLTGRSSDAGRSSTARASPSARPCKSVRPSR